MGRARSKVAPLGALLLLLASTGCAQSMRYVPVGPRVVAESAAPRLIYVDLIDARVDQGATFPERKSLFDDPERQFNFALDERYWTQLTTSARKSVWKAGLSTADAPFRPTPKRVEDVEAAVKAAADAGADAALFLRLTDCRLSGHIPTAVGIIGTFLWMIPPPWLVTIFLPVNDEHAWGGFEAILVDGSGQLLGRFHGTAEHEDDSSTFFRHSPQKELTLVLRDAMQRALTELGSAVTAGKLQPRPFDLAEVLAPWAAPAATASGSDATGR